MKLIFTWKEILIYDNGKELGRYAASCDVRTELNGRRQLHTKSEVVKTYPISGERSPYMPRQHPSGIFTIYEVEHTTDPEYSPCKIRSTAYREVFIWELDATGGYDHATEETQTDSGYLIHNTDSATTLGCIRCKEAGIIGEIVEKALKNNEPVKLEVL